MKTRGAIAGAWLALGPVFLGADLTARLTPLTPHGRRGAPEWVEVDLTTAGTGLREGALDFELRVEGEKVYRYRSRELALTAGAQQFRFLLPAAPNDYQAPMRTWKLRFIEPTRTIELGEFSSPPRLTSGRDLVLAVVRSGVARETPAWQALRLERFAPPMQNSSRLQAPPTAPVFLDPDDLPSDSAGYCAFDAVLLDGDALSLMREKARAALTRWVHAGGSLAVIAPIGLEDPHLAFLNQLGAPDPHWRPVSTPFTGILSARANFGRLVVSAESPPEELTAEWRQAAAFLWKLRGAPFRALAFEPIWQEHHLDSHESSGGDYYASISRALVSMLVPHRFRPLPVAALWIVISAFIVVVGPLDWWLLGTLRRRRWTWITFPCIAVAFTLFTIALARHFLGGAKGRGELVITDLGTDGQVVRQTRINLSVPVSESEVTAEINGSVGVPLTTPSSSGTAPPRYDGSFPSRYQLTMEGRQWTPVLWRTTSFEPAKDTSGVAWRAPDELLPSGFNKSLRGTSQAIFDTFSHGRQRSTESGFPSPEWYRNLVIGPRWGSFIMLGSSSPTGSPFLEDLVCLDNDSTDTSVVVALHEEGSTIHVWRHLFLH